MPDAPDPAKQGTDRAAEAPQLLDDEAQNIGLVRELWELIRYNKKWWLLPVIIVLLVIGLLVALGSSALAPFLYPLF